MLPRVALHVMLRRRDLQHLGPLSLAQRAALHAILQAKGGEQDQRVPLVELAELVKVDQPVVVRVEVLHGRLEVARERRAARVDDFAQVDELIFVDRPARVRVEPVVRVGVYVVVYMMYKAQQSGGM